MNKKDTMYAKIERHGEELIKFFNLDKTIDPIKLSKRLFSLENKAHHATTCLCNTNTLNLTEKEEDEFFYKIRKRLSNIIGEDNAEKCFINHDPREYALKIKEEYSKDFYYHDMGGFGILAPDFVY